MTVRLLLLVNVLLLAIAFAMFTLISPGHLKAYQLYLSESRPALQLDYTALSQDWDEGVRLVGWQLPNGSAVFYNRDRPFDFTQFNGIDWASPRPLAPA
jgi:hypothetical protein